MYNTNTTFSGYTFIVILLTSSLIVSCSSKEPNPLTHKNFPFHNLKDSTHYYEYRINLPDYVNRTVIADTLQQYARSMETDFLNMLPVDTSDFFTVPWLLQIAIEKKFESDRFVAYLSDYYAFTGGAHGAPAKHSFLFDKQKQQPIQLRDLFTDTLALRNISQYARKELENQFYTKIVGQPPDEQTKAWIAEGTSPKFKNFTTFLPAYRKDGKATGIDIIFATYQVGPYFIGMPKIFIPASIFFEDLRPSYQSAFTK